MNLSNYGEELVLNTLFRDPTKPVYLGLATAPITDTSTLATISEVTDAGYTRKQVTFSTPVQENGKGTIKNSATLTYGVWQVNQPSKITHAFLTYDQTGTTGNIIEWMPIPTEQQPQPLQSENAIIQANNVILTVD